MIINLPRSIKSFLKKGSIAVLLLASGCANPFMSGVYKLSNAEIIATGFAVDKHHIITNAHVCGSGGDFVALGVDGKEHHITIDDMDLNNDLCLMSTKDTLKPLVLAKRGEYLGQPVVVFGSPDGLFPVLTSGYVGWRHEKDGQDVFLISSPIWPGSSGSPVLNQKQEVIGVVMAYHIDTKFGIAIPIRFVKMLLKRNNIKIN